MLRLYEEKYDEAFAESEVDKQMMKKHGYDRYEEHKADHERLLDNIGDITEEFETTDRLDEELFKQKLADWFQVHFKTHDSRLHKRTNMESHEQIDESALKSLIKAAKNKLLGKM